MSALVDGEAEKTVLGCVLLNEEALFHVLPLLRPDDFGLSSHHRIYQTVCELTEASKKVEAYTVIERLDEKGVLETVGGPGYVACLSNSITCELASMKNVEHYAERVLDYSRRRSARAAAISLAKAVEDTSTPLDELLGQLQDGLLSIEADARKTTARSTKEIMGDVLRELQVQASNSGVVGMTTGLACVDIATGGIRPGELWTIGGLPGRGKSALGVQILLANAAAGTPVCAFSLEMTDVEIGKRFLVAKSNIAAVQVRNPASIKKERFPELLHAAGQVAEMPIHVDSRPSLSIPQLMASARLYIRHYGVRLIVVDYLRLVSAPGKELRERVGHVADGLRQLAKSEHVAVVMLSQLKRPEGGVNAHPTMIDLKESGDIEAHSHVVLLPYLPAGKDGRPMPEEELLIIGKNRNGAVGPLPVYFDERRLQFFERTSCASAVGN